MSMTVMCNRCDVPAQIDDRNDETTHVYCPMCGADFGSWGDISVTMPAKQNQAFRDRESWRAVER